MEYEDIVGPGLKESILARGGESIIIINDLWKRAPQLIR
jgi:hypothetical protein